VVTWCVQPGRTFASRRDPCGQRCQRRKQQRPAARFHNARIFEICKAARHGGARRGRGSGIPDHGRADCAL